jgi:GTPase SAR1 family protein
MTPMYYRNADLAILVFDVTDRGTFLRIDHWKDELRATNTSADIILVGNKIDKPGRDPVVTEAVRLWRQNNPHILYFETR